VERARELAEAGLAQGQSVAAQVRAKRRADELLRELGAAYYAETRGAGGREAVVRALAELDAHVAEHGPLR
jgi:hypothetical protein